MLALPQPGCAVLPELPHVSGPLCSHQAASRCGASLPQHTVAPSPKGRSEQAGSTQLFLLYPLLPSRVDVPWGGYTPASASFLKVFGMHPGKQARGVDVWRLEGASRRSPSAFQNTSYPALSGGRGLASLGVSIS